MTKPRSFDIKLTITGRFELSPQEATKIIRDANEALALTRSIKEGEVVKDKYVNAVRGFDKNVLKGAPVDEYNLDLFCPFAIKVGFRFEEGTLDLQDLKKDLKGYQLAIKMDARGKTVSAQDE